ncbi:MAG: hybrid sensor histidine kinase/response regulator [Acidobacteriota bacterium]
MRVSVQELVGALLNVSGRQETARALAKQLGADDLIFFVTDPEIGIPLPVPGFPQTLPAGRSWRAFLAQCVVAGRHSAELPFPSAQSIVAATAVAAKDGTVLVLLGGAPRIDEFEEIGWQLPLLGAALRGEQSVISAAGHSKVAREAVADARALAERLDVARTELQRALLAAEAATRAKDEFMAVVSHELRTPLNAILGWTQILRTGKPDQAKMERALEIIERNVKSQTKLIEDILDFSRIISGKLRLDVQPVELAAVLEATVEVVRPAADAKGVLIQAIIDPRAGSVSGDPDRLQQVLWNLLSNAIKFTPKGGRVQIRLARANSHVEIDVSDTGQGIDPDFLPLIFQRFRQADTTTTRRHTGLGLGLAITQHLVELHGGTISAYSGGTRQGARFVLRLPVLALHNSERLPPARPSDQNLADQARTVHANLPRLDGLHVLVADDERDARDLLTAVLVERGARVTAAATAAEALAMFQSLKPDLLISDIAMPGEDGFSLIRRVRSLEKEQGTHTPAIALTAHAGSSDRMQALSAGYQIHLPKPVEAAELITVVANLAGRKSNAL